MLSDQIEFMGGSFTAWGQFSVCAAGAVAYKRRSGPGRGKMRRRRRLWIILLATPLLLIGADTVYWRLAERHLEDGFAAWIAGWRASGWTATVGKPVRGGWPLAATLTVPEVLLNGGDPNIPGGLTWRTDRLVLRADLLRPGLLDVASEGMQRLRLAGRPEIPFTADQLRMALPLQPGAPPRSATIIARDLHATVPAGAETSGSLTIGSLDLHLEFKPAAQAGETALGFAFNADAVGLPPPFARLLGPRISSLTLQGALDGPVPRPHVLGELASAWRDGGGTLEIQRLAVNWGPLDLTASATLALDEQQQPMGTGSARVVGYAETLDALATHGIISKSAATAAKAVLSLLASAPDDGGPPDVEVPLTLQYRTLSMRQVPLLRLPEIDWP
jgi:hypothetical protein